MVPGCGLIHGTVVGMNGKPWRRECSAKEGILNHDAVCPLFAQPDAELQRMAENRREKKRQGGA